MEHFLSFVKHCVKLFLVSDFFLLFFVMCLYMPAKCSVCAAYHEWKFTFARVCNWLGRMHFSCPVVGFFF